jgi:hypothetical protein
MKEESFELRFNGRRELNSSRKKALYIYGIILLLIGLFGMVKSNFATNHLFWYILTVGGILNVIHGFFGKELIKEKNYILINSENIEYKNSSKKPKRIKTDNLLDLRIETAKVEFVYNDQRVESYDFSVFQRQELDSIYSKLETVKANLIK